MFFLTPRHIKEGRHYRQAVKRLIHYKSDILPAKDIETLNRLVVDMTAALKSRQREKIYAVRDEIEKQAGKIAPPPPDSAWRENVEVFLVAIVVAAGVRAYFLQPFKIPTGSMQPTLFGVVATPTDTPPPNPLIRAFEFLWLGRSYFDLQASEDDVIQEVKEKTYLNFFTFTDVIGKKTHYMIFAPKDTLKAGFGVEQRREYHRGDNIVRGYIDTGDQVFVDKMSYQFRAPRAGDVLVFNTAGIWRIQTTLPPGIASEHYIKRLAGVPGATLRVDSPDLFINGKLASLPGFQRVMSRKNGYQGYSNIGLLGTPEETFTVPAHSYFAMGDNSYNSFDSRYWGVVPGQNVTGSGLFVYWPFSKRWGLIH